MIMINQKIKYSKEMFLLNKGFYKIKGELKYVYIKLN